MNFLNGDFNNSIEKLKLYAESMYDDHKINEKNKNDLNNHIQKIKKILQKTENNINQNNDYETPIEKIIGYVPLEKAKYVVSMTKFDSDRKKAIKYMASEKFDSAYKKFSYLSKTNHPDATVQYYWMGIISLKIKNYSDATLHFAQFYKSAYKNKDIYKKNTDKIPRSIVNIIECLVNLKHKNAAQEMLGFFEAKYPNHRKSMHEKYLINQIKKY